MNRPIKLWISATLLALIGAGGLCPAAAQPEGGAPPEAPGPAATEASRPAAAEAAGPHGARGLVSAPADPPGGVAAQAARILLFPVRAALEVGTFPLREAGGAISSTGLLQRMARGYESGRYLVPVFGVDPLPGANVGLRIGHGSFFDPRGCVTWRLAYGGTDEQLYALTLRSRDAELIPYRSGWSYRVTAKYEIVPRKSYFGLGNLSRREDLCYYARERYLLLATLRRALTPWVRWDLTAAIQRSQIKAPTGLAAGEKSILEVLPSEISSPGLAVDPQNIQGELALVLDRRDERGRPHRGWKAEGFFGYAHGTGADGVSYVRYGSDLQGFLPLGARHTLALHAAGEEARTGDLDAAGRAVPIKLTELPALGGRSTLRGYLADRYIDNAVFFWTGEYRYRLSHLIEAALFADFGKTLPRLLDIDFTDLHRSFGAGLRMASDDEFYFTLQLARSDEDIVFTATLEPAFDRVDRRERR